MSDSVVTLHADGMHCHGCEHIIEGAVKKIPGVRTVKADYPTETVRVDFDPGTAPIDDIRRAIERAGYRTQSLEARARRRGVFPRLATLLGGLAGIAFIILLDVNWISQNGAPDISQHMSLGLIFLLGLLTGFHCVGMCGGFVLSYTAADARAGRAPYLSHVFYGAGKTLSYTVIGAAFGLLGAFVAFTPLLRGAAGMAAGVFLIVFGLNMLGLFAPLRRFRLALPTPLQAFLERRRQSRHRPFVIGLLNGLMIACGPLQAMYLMAAGTGSSVEGAKMLLAFGLGTLPVLSAFGVLTGLISSSLTHRLLKASGVIVVVLGAVMINRGLILTGWGYDLASVVAAFRKTGAVGAPQPPAQSSPTVQSEDAAKAALAGEKSPFQTIQMEASRSGYSPSHFVVTKGVRVKWLINGREITECNKRIVVPALNLEFDVRKGSQVIEFMPEKTGLIHWSCWMGMLRGEFDVVEASPVLTEAAGAAERTPLEEKKDLAPESGRTYTIVAGDSLRRIARKLFGEERRWRDIAAANPGLDPRRLRPGQIIKRPAADADTSGR